MQLQWNCNVICRHLESRDSQLRNSWECTAECSAELFKEFEKSRQTERLPWQLETA